MSQLVLRFDVDTPLCVTVGMGKLNQLSKEFNVPFVYFVNFGRAVDVIARFRHRLSNSTKHQIEKLGSLKKLGLVELVKLMVNNPRLGNYCDKPIREALEQGSEIAVHGGRNHGSWQWGYPHWSDQRLATEIGWSTEFYRHLLGCQPLGFSSPGWVSDDRLPKLLSKFGYHYLADLHGPVSHRDLKIGMKNFATVLTGEPGGVGFIESCAARQISESEIISLLERSIVTSKSPVVMYDHPNYVVRSGLPMVRAILKHALRKGWKVCTLADCI